jgi:tRNA(fMet)-specific endonuclease VapC
MAGSYLLDTNIVIYYFGEDADIVARLDALETVFLPLFVLGELYYGVFNSDRKTANLAKLSQFIGKFDILYPDEETSRQYGQIKAELQQKGRPLPDNDIWLAALTRQHKHTLASRDQHFSFVDGILWESW